MTQGQEVEMHSPFRSESDVFRGVVMLGLGIAFAVGLGALTDATVGGIVAGAIFGLAVGLALRAGRGSLPGEVEIASRGDGYRILVVANQTVTGAELMREVANRAAGRSALELLVVCPALTRSRLEQIASDTDGARAEAEERLRRSLASLREVGLRASGAIGDEDPIQATADALREFGADELIVSTHPPSQSRWLERGVVEQIRDRFELPLTHVVVEGKAGSSAAA